MAKAQFQSGHYSLSPQRTITRDRPLTASEACSVLDDLDGEIRNSGASREVFQGASTAINSLKDRIRSNASNGMTGNGFSQNWGKKEFTVGRYRYRIDFELSGDIKDS
jgi:hypothetical protein